MVRIADGVTEFTPLQVVAVSADYTATLADEVILVDASSAAVTITLPSPTKGHVLIIKKIDSSANTVTVQVADTTTQTIDGATSQTLSTQWESVTVVSDGTNWYII